MLPLLLNISHLARFTCRPSAGPNSSIKCKARSTAERVPAKAPLSRYHAWRRISAHSSSASRLDSNFWRASVIAKSIAADPSVDIEETHASLPPMPVIVDFVGVKPYQMMPPLFSVWCVCMVCGVCVCCVCVCGGVCAVCVDGVCVWYTTMCVCAQWFKTMTFLNHEKINT